jgi:hypothetical protein
MSKFCWKHHLAVGWDNSLQTEAPLHQVQPALGWCRPSETAMHLTCWLLCGAELG